MKLGLVVIGDGRVHYLHQAINSVHAHCYYPISARILINDEANPGYCSLLDEEYPDWTRIHTHRAGMAGAVQAGFQAALDARVEQVLWVEEDFTLTRRLPIGEAAAVLDHHPDIAQMSFRREPIDPVEIELGCVLAAMTSRSAHQINETYTLHSWIFSLNPCLIPAAVLRLGWPAGPLGVGNESGFTEKCLADGYQFGSWGQPGDGMSWCRHIGARRSNAWKL